MWSKKNICGRGNFFFFFMYVKACIFSVTACYELTFNNKKSCYVIKESAKLGKS